MRVLVAIATIASIAANEAGGKSAEAQERSEPQVAQQVQGTAATLDYTVDPFDRMMELITSANVRAGPSKRYEVLGIAKIGERVRVTGKVRDRNWVQVATPANGVSVAFIYAPLLKQLQPEILTHAEYDHGGVQPIQKTAPAADRAPNSDNGVELVKSAIAGSEQDERASLLTIARITDQAENNDGAPPTRHTRVVSSSQIALPDADDGLVLLHRSSLEVPKPERPSQPLGPDWSIAENQPCQVWNYGNREYEPLLWSGSCVEGRASGEGRLVFRGGEGMYEGGMLGGKLHGHGVLSWSDGFRYEGELREGKQHGIGILTRASGESYDGGWREGKPHGHGAYLAAGGETYKGAWRDGCFSDQHGRRAWLGSDAVACGFE